MFSVRKGLSLDVADGERFSAGPVLRSFELSSSCVEPASAPVRPARRQRLAGPFASLSTAFLSALPAEKAPGKDQIKEPTTSITYPEEYCTRGAFGCTKLTGLGVRTKNLVVAHVNVYTIGVYVDHGGAKTQLAKHTAKTAEQIAASQDVYDDVLRSDGINKSLRLVINYGRLKKSQFLDALDERMAPSLKKAGLLAELEAFRRQFEPIELHKGTEFVFSAERGGRLTTRVDGKEMGTMVSPPLVHALFDIYLGKDPVSPTTKKSFGRGLAAVLHQQA